MGKTAEILDKIAAAKGMWSVPQYRSGRKSMTMATLLKKDLDGTLHKKLAELKTELLPHQRRVVDRMLNPEQSGLVVAHGLGSGKTLTSIAVHDALGGKAAVILPAALQENYAKEQRKHVAGTPMEADVTTLQALARGDTGPEADLLIVDEAHRLRETSSKGTQAVRKTTAPKRLLLTGSPFYNRPSDIAPLINIAAARNMLPAEQNEFAKKYITDQVVKPGLWGKLVRGETSGVVQVPNPKTAPELRQIFQKYVDYHPSSTEGFPEVERRDVEVPMSKQQLKLYDTILGKAPPWVAAKIKSGLPPSKQESQQLNAFATGVRQIANSTAAHQVGGEVHKPKIDAAFANMQKLLNDDPRGKGVVYSNYLDAGIHPYRQLLEQAKIPHGVFTGELSKRERDEMVRQYNEDKLKVLLLSGAGGEGLDLKGTKLMQVLEPHWNEEKIRQAEGRAARYKSHEHLPEAERKVLVERYIAKRPTSGVMETLGLSKPGGSIDEYLAKRSKEKEDLHARFRELMGAGK